MRIRGSVVIVKNNKVGLIKRVREDHVYYVFPGGGIEQSETIEEGTKREALEELGVQVKVNELLATYEYNGTQYFYHCEIIGGVFGTGSGEEYLANNKDRGTYMPIWLEIEKLPFVDVRPKEVALKLFKIYK